MTMEEGIDLPLYAQREWSTFVAPSPDILCTGVMMAQDISKVLCVTQVVTRDGETFFSEGNKLTKAHAMDEIFGLMKLQRISTGIPGRLRTMPALRRKHEQSSQYLREYRNQPDN